MGDSRKSISIKDPDEHPAPLTPEQSLRALMETRDEAEPASAEKPVRRRSQRGGLSIRLTTGGFVLFLAADLIVLGLLGWPILQARSRLPGSAVQPSNTASPLPSATLAPTETSTPEPPTLTPNPTANLVAPYPGQPPQTLSGLIVLSKQEGARSHLFAYQPQTLPITRLTSGDWDDIEPAFSPDGSQVAFTSNRNGYWDLYILVLSTGEVKRLTDSPAFEGAPTWSPDGLWLAYEQYTGEGGLDIFIRPVANDTEPVRLTDHPGADTSPAWSPLGRQIAFVSDRSGEAEIWLADLDQGGDQRFTNLSQDNAAIESAPTWSADGNRLAWSGVEGGYHRIYLWQSQGDEGPPNTPRQLGSGDIPVWSPDGNVILAVLNEPNQTYLTAYPVQTEGLVLPALELPGAVRGLDWAEMPAGSFQQLPIVYQEAARLTPMPLWLPSLSNGTEIPGNRRQIIDLQDVEAPNPMLSDMIDDSFQALRAAAARDTGWDFLSSLENAYVPLTTSLDPGMEGDWLYTGRAFSFNTLPMNANWVVVVREDYGLQTYWRVYLRARFQDGSAGEPLHDLPWDFNARLSGDTTSYEQGGRLADAIPPGYWIDFTRLASTYGWERLPALVTWRSSYPAARLNEFVLRDGIDWGSAMLELYPPEILVTSTAIIPPTRTLTPTSRWYQSPTPTLTPTPRPTWTPLPASESGASMTNTPEP